MLPTVLVFVAETSSFTSTSCMLWICSSQLESSAGVEKATTKGEQLDINKGTKGTEMEGLGRMQCGMEKFDSTERGGLGRMRGRVWRGVGWFDPTVVFKTLGPCARG